MADAFAVSLSALPKYGLRTRSGTASALHRFAEDRAVPACATQADGGATSTNPGNYKRVRLALDAESRRFSLCSHDHCFGRLHIAQTPDAGPDQPPETAEHQIV